MENQPQNQNHVVAVDIDLGRATAVADGQRVIAHCVPLETLRRALSFFAPHGVVLIEVAGPTLHHKESHSFRRWMLYNMASAIDLAHAVGVERTRFATSTAWTRGFTEEARQRMAGIIPLKYTAKGNPVYGPTLPHDVRECIAMTYFFRNHPQTWLTLPELMASLVGTSPEKPIVQAKRRSRKVVP